MLECPSISLKISGWKVRRGGRQALSIYLGKCSGTYRTPGPALGGTTRQERIREGPTLSRGGGSRLEPCARSCAARGTRSLLPRSPGPAPHSAAAGPKAPLSHTRRPRSPERLPRAPQPSLRHGTQAEAACAPRAAGPRPPQRHGNAPHRPQAAATAPPRQRGQTRTRRPGPARRSLPPAGAEPLPGSFSARDSTVAMLEMRSAHARRPALPAPSRGLPGTVVWRGWGGSPPFPPHLHPGGDLGAAPLGAPAASRCWGAAGGVARAVPGVPVTGSCGRGPPGGQPGRGPPAPEGLSLGGGPGPGGGSAPGGMATGPSPGRCRSAAAACLA